MPSAVAGLHDVSKRFGSIAALDGVTVELTGGAVHAIVGENGAGKSTMVNILSGVLSPDSGTVMLAGAPAKFRAPSDAMRAGISTIYQERALVPQLTVGENIVLGHERSRFGLIEKRRKRRRALFLASGTARRRPAPADGIAPARRAAARRDRKGALA